MGPVVIIGLILLIAAVFLVGGATKIDEHIQAKRREKRQAESAKKGDENSKAKSDVFDAESDATISADTVSDSTETDASIRADVTSDESNATISTDTASDSEYSSEDSSVESEELSAKDAGRLRGNMESAEGELSIFRHKDGSLNAYIIIKMVGLVSVIVAAIMIVVGMK